MNVSQVEGEDLLYISAFPKKLYNIVNNPNNQGIISWNKTGDQFIIHNPTEFSEKILSGSDFVSSNYASFVRQLNIYDFHKVKNRIKDQSNTFCHKFFLKDRPSLLRHIKRKVVSNSNSEDVMNQFNYTSIPDRDNEQPINQHSIQNTNLIGNKQLISGESTCAPNCKQVKENKFNKHILSALYSNFLKSVSSTNYF